MIIAISNQKGGVGKTVTSINLAAALGREKKSVLLVDMDPQGHSTICFLEENYDPDSLFNVFRGETKVEKALVPIPEEKISLLPSGISLAKVERDLIAEVDGHFALKDLLAPVRDAFDFIIIDTPPALGMLTVNCLVAADYVIIPIQASYLSLEGTDDLLDTISRIRARFNPDLEILGALITILDKRTTLGKDVVRRIEDLFGERVFDTPIAKSVRLEESPAYRESIFRYDPGSSSAREYRKIAKEVISRVSQKRTS